MWLKAFIAFLTLLIHSEIPDDDIIENDPPIPESSVINLHVMTTSHIEPGWTHTFEEYYQGTSDQSVDCAKCVLDNVYTALSANSQRKYDMAEIAFFQRWWKDLSQEKQDTFKGYIQNKQFEFVNGGWVANDEACAYYDDIIDNMILGHRWLDDNLGVYPVVGWQIDSFGSSATQAALMAQAGYDGLLFSRADFTDRKTRIFKNELQFNWEPPSPHNESIFTEMMYTQFNNLSWISEDTDTCQSLFCGGEFTSAQYKNLATYANLQAKSLLTKNVLLLVSDNHLTSEEGKNDFNKAEALIKYYNGNPDMGIQAKFSHLSDYLSQVNQDLLDFEPELPVKHDDFFPYIQSQNQAWVGFYTSKSMYKLLTRQYSEYYNSVKLLLTKFMLLNDADILKLDEDQHSSIDQALNGLEESLALVQHHESITGTMKESVRSDYENRLSQGRQGLEDVLQPILLKFLQKNLEETLETNEVRYDWFYQDENYDDVFQEGKIVTIAIYNPGHTRSILQRIQVPTANFKIINDANKDLLGQIICHSEDMSDDCYIYFTDTFSGYSTQVYKLVDLESGKALGKTDIGANGIKLQSKGQEKTLNIDADLINFDYTICVSQEICTSDSFSLDYKYYESSTKSDQDRVPSGAYVFSPISKKRLDYSSVKSGRVYKGDAFTLVQIFRDNLRTDIMFLNDPSNKELEITSYLEPVIKSGKEIVLLITSSNINNGDIFYTDANGYFMQKRQKDQKDNYQISATSSVGRNYYPMTSNMYIEDPASTQRLSVITDRAQGATAYNPGEIEVMIHRVTPSDDLQGLGEPLQEKDPETKEMIKVITRHFIDYSQTSKSVFDNRRKQQYALDRALQLWFFSSDKPTFGKTLGDVQAEGVFETNYLKIYVRSYFPNEYIVRVHNLNDEDSIGFEIYDRDTMECLLLKRLINSDTIKLDTIAELSLTTTKQKSDLGANKLDPTHVHIPSDDQDNLATINLLPMEIRTFAITLAD